MADLKDSVLREFSTKLSNQHHMVLKSLEKLFDKNELHCKWRSQWDCGNSSGGWELNSPQSLWAPNSPQIRKWIAAAKPIFQQRNCSPHRPHRWEMTTYKHWRTPGCGGWYKTKNGTYPGPKPHMYAVFQRIKRKIKLPDLVVRNKWLETFWKSHDFQPKMVTVLGKKYIKLSQPEKKISTPPKKMQSHWTNGSGQGA